MNEILQLTVEGVTYKLGRIGFALRLGAAEEIRQQRRAEFAAVMGTLGSLSEVDRSKTTLAAIDNLMRNICVSKDECIQWLGSQDGEVYQLWRSLQAVDPAATRAQALQLLNDMDVEDYDKVQAYWMSFFLKAE